MRWPMHQALRCRAKSKRSGLECQAPAVKGSKFAACTGLAAALPRARTDAYPGLGGLRQRLLGAGARG